MPKSREDNREHLCSFCGVHKDDAPLVVVSNQTKACVCATCALAVIEQTFALMIKQDVIIRRAVSGPQNPTKPKIQVVKTDSVKNAVDKAINDSK